VVTVLGIVIAKYRLSVMGAFGSQSRRCKTIYSLSNFAQMILVNDDKGVIF